MKTTIKPNPLKTKEEIYAEVREKIAVAFTARASALNVDEIMQTVLQDVTEQQDKIVASLLGVDKRWSEWDIHEKSILGQAITQQTMQHVEKIVAEELQQLLTDVTTNKDHRIRKTIRKQLVSRLEGYSMERETAAAAERILGQVVAAESAEAKKMLGLTN